MLSGRSATVESQPLPSLTQLLGSPGEAEVLLEQPQLFITGMRIFKRGRRSEVEYLMSFPAFPGQDDWVSKRRLETDKSIDGRQLIQDFETGSIVEDEDADAPNEADAGTAATSPLAPFTQLPMPDTAMQGAQRLSQPAHVASQAQLLPPFTQPPFPETQQTAGISSPHASAPGMNPLHWQLAASEGSKGHLTSAERPTGRVHATKQHINPSQVSMDRQSPSPQQQAASQAEAAFRRLAQNPRSPTRASGAGQNAAQPVPSSQAERSQPAAVAGQGFRMVNGLPSYLWGEGTAPQASHAAATPAASPSDVAAAMWGKAHVPSRSPPLLAPAASSSPAAHVSLPQAGAVLTTMPPASSVQHAAHVPASVAQPVQQRPASSVQPLQLTAEGRIAEAPAHAPGRQVDADMLLEPSAAASSFMAMCYRLTSSSAPRPPPAVPMLQAAASKPAAPQPSVHTSPVSPAAAIPAQPLSEFATPPPGQGLSSDDEDDDGSSSDVSLYEAHPLRQPAPDKTHAVPVDLVPDSEEPGPQPEANSPHGMQQPSSPVQQQPGYSHADRGDAGKRAASPVREDSQHAEQEDVAAPYDTAQNAQAWESVRQHFAPGRTRHDRALRHAGRFTDVRLRSHRAAQADDMARYARHAQSLADADSEDGDATDPDYDPAYDDGAVNDTQPTHEQPAPKRLRQHTDIDKHKQAQLPFAQPHITDHPPDSIHTAEQLDADVVQYLQPQQWLDAQIIGAKQTECGLLLHVAWGEDCDTWLDHTHLKARQHCKDELIRFYESKIRKVSKSKS